MRRYKEGAMDDKKLPTLRIKGKAGDFTKEDVQAAITDAFMKKLKDAHKSGSEIKIGSQKRFGK
jgi:hypothetical protein